MKKCAERVQRVQELVCENWILEVRQDLSTLSLVMKRSNN